MHQFIFSSAIASAISLTDTENTTLKKYNLMHEINARGTWLVTKVFVS